MTQALDHILGEYSLPVLFVDGRAYKGWRKSVNTSEQFELPTDFECPADIADFPAGEKQQHHRNRFERRLSCM